MDGSMVPIVQTGNDPDQRKGKKLIWREARLCCARSKDAVLPLYGATLGSVEIASAMWSHTARLAGCASGTQVHGVGDGAPWILNTFQENFGQQGTYTIDFYQVSEYLAAAAPTVAKRGQETLWRRRQQGRLLNNQRGAVLRALETAREKKNQSEAPVRAAYEYIHERRDHMDYAAARKNNLPIGSGEIESGHRDVIQQRLKLSGGWWTEKNMERMLQPSSRPIERLVGHLLGQYPKLTGSFNHTREYLASCENGLLSHTSRAMTNQTANNTVLSLELPGIKKLKSGKVREIFDLGDAFLFVASDRISAFDCVMPNGIPRKGEVLTQLSHFWFDQVANIVPNHRLAGANDPLPANLKPFEAQIARRSMIVKKAKPLAVECIVRGYLAGSGWKEYKKSQTVCGVKLPPGLQDSSELPEPIFTPSTKAETGHDENIDFEAATKIVGRDIAERVRDISIKVYSFAREYARKRGIIIADTKFEFGTLPDGSLILIDEVLTPDSSRFWPADQYAPGKSQPSFDKQFVRDYLETLNWDKNPPAPALPPHIVEKTTAKYVEAYEKITGKKL
jgi:phosphoribosylaminoimidazole-succinocarboxamide synthase